MAAAFDSPDTVQPGTPVLVAHRKYDGTAHWRQQTVYLGADEFGHWVGGRAGQTISKPGRSLVAASDWVLCLPRDRWHTLTVNGRHPDVRVHQYVDVGTVVTWHQDPSGLQARAIDLDLDVVRTYAGDLYIDDVEEFADHRIRYGYPEDVVRAAERECELVHREMAGDREPFAGRGDGWLEDWSSR